MVLAILAGIICGWGIFRILRSGSDRQAMVAHDSRSPSDTNDNRAVVSYDEKGGEDVPPSEPLELTDNTVDEKPVGRAVLSDDPAIAEIERQMTDAARAIDKAQSDARANDSEIIALNAERRELQRRLVERFYGIPTLAEKLSARSAVFEKLQKLQERQDELNSLQAQNGEDQSVRKDLATIAVEIEKLRAEATSIVKDLEQAKKDAINTDGEASRLSRAMDQCEETARTKLNGLPTVVEMRKKRADLQKEYDALRTKKNGK